MSTAPPTPDPTAGSGGLGRDGAAGAVGSAGRDGAAGGTGSAGRDGAAGGTGRAGGPATSVVRRPRRAAGRSAWLSAAALTLAVAVAACSAPAGGVPIPVAQSAPTPTSAVTARGGGPIMPASSTPAPVPTARASSTATRTTATPSPGRPASRTPASPGDRPVVVLDPGHNGGNASALSTVTRLVDAGFGQRKPCNTVGASTVGGYAEHEFTWDVALRTRRLLAARGLRVLLTRPDDRGVGPCVDARAHIGNAAGADAVVSIHADGVVPDGHGFHVIEAAVPPAGAAVAAASHRLATAVRTSFRDSSGFGYATYVGGGDGLDRRADLAGLNLSTRPAIFLECGNMRNPDDAARMVSRDGRQRIAAALAGGILAALAAR